MTAPVVWVVSRHYAHEAGSVVGVAATAEDGRLMADGILACPYDNAADKAHAWEGAPDGSWTLYIAGYAVPWAVEWFDVQPVTVGTVVQ